MTAIAKLAPVIPAQRPGIVLLRIGAGSGVSRPEVPGTCPGEAAYSLLEIIGCSLVANLWFSDCDGSLVPAREPSPFPETAPRSVERNHNCARQPLAPIRHA